MKPPVVTEKRVEHARGRVAAYDGLAERYRGDADFRSRIDGGDVTDVLSEIGLDPPPGVEIRIVADTADTVHVVLPPDPNVSLADESLSMVAGGKTTGTSGTTPEYAATINTTVYAWRIQEYGSKP